MQCIKRLYNCQNAGISKSDCPNVALCSAQPVEAESENDLRTESEVAPPSSYLPPGNNPQFTVSPINNGHGKPVGTFSEQDLPNLGDPDFSGTTPHTTSGTRPPLVMGSKPTNRK